ncbi:MAG: trmB [Chlamydiales bacterium]|jgi:tRNA (guanine-N7-)-methyltransferase|nr:trmB [Chlamydiales bacterium]
MRPQDIKAPFSWNEREVLLQDRVLYVPEHYEHYEKFSFPAWDSEALFDNQKPIFLEFCSGNGTWIVERAIDFPEVNWVSVEMQFIRAKKIIFKREKFLLDNLVVICGEGHKVASHYLQDSSVDEVYINFPDPWPKRRHAKHRIIQPAFIEQLARILRFKGKLTLVTDDQPYSEIMIAELLNHRHFTSLYPEPYYSHSCPGYGTSFFEQLWRSKGKPIYYHTFEKSAPYQPSSRTISP